MRRVEGKLADWHQLHKRLEEARLQLEAAPDGAARQILEAEVRRLTQEDDEAIQAVQVAIATAKKMPGVTRPAADDKAAGPDGRTQW